MNPQLIKFLSLIILLFGLNKGCEKDPEFLPGLRGNMVGYLYTLDEFGTVLNDHSGVLITALGLEGSYQTYSNAQGRFELSDLPTGTYELHFEKEGFGVLKQFGIKHLGGKVTVLLHDGRTTKAYFLYEISETRIEDLLLENDTLTATCIFAEAGWPSWISVNLYFSTEEGFDTRDAQYILSMYLSRDGGSYSRKLPIGYHPFNNGERFYFRAGVFTRPQNWNLPDMYLNDFYGPDTYVDYETGQTIYPNLGEISEQYVYVSEK